MEPTLYGISRPIHSNMASVSGTCPKVVTEYTRAIPIRGGEVAIVDYQDYRRFMKLNWYLSGPRKNYARCYIKGVGNVQMHHLVLQPPPGYQVDHINGNTLDNRRSNLRIATHQQNMRNKGPVGKCKYKGVCKHKRRGLYSARITADGKTVNLGYFKKAEDAARAYDEAAKQLHGEFAFLNFPKDRLRFSGTAAR